MHAAQHFTPTKYEGSSTSESRAFRSSTSNSTACEASATGTVSEPPHSQHGLGSQVLSDRQAVIAVMAANGRTYQFIASKLRLPVRTVEGYLHQALEILGVTQLEDLTYPLIAAHFTSTRPQNLHTLESDASMPSATTPDPAPQTIDVDHLPAPVSEVGAAPASREVFMPLSGASDQLIDGRFIDGAGSNSLVIMDAAEAAHEAAAAVQTVVRESGRDHNDNDDPGQGAARRPELIAAFELLKQKRETARNLEKAVHSRDVIGQAKGILMERYNISADAAFAILQDESSRTNQKIVDLAAQLTYTG